MNTLMKSKKNTKHIPRCPLCFVKMESMQLVFAEDPNNQGTKIWQEVWTCDSCHTNHVFPARISVMEAARNSVLLERSARVLYLPK